MPGKATRLNRLFNRGQNVVIIAADHGEFDGPIPGMVRMQETLSRIDPAVDAVLLSPGMAGVASKVFGFKGAPLMVLRLNWSTVYCFGWGYREAQTVQAVDAAEAVRLGADVALISLTLRTGSEERDSRNVELFCRLRADCHRLGLPVVGEYFPPAHSELSPDPLHEHIRTGCRVLAELGADCIKTFHTHKFPDVVEGCPVPIFCLGAERLPTPLDALRLAQRAVAEGARGVVFGRNALQVPDPPAFQRALCDVVKRGVRPEEAAAQHGVGGWT
jgi:DhnA family fructose-bisphosphate aldolase class Ia